MAKSRSKRADYEEALKKRRDLLWKVVWVVIVLLSAAFGYSNGAPLVAAGQLAEGITIGLAYGGGAFLALAGAIFLNRKLKGM
ncbi:MAG: hypothetical protein KDF65_16400 [Anaerolineae bacterium]|nr:hypothetical protein [Anaerolineae bacterium]